MPKQQVDRWTRRKSLSAAGLAGCGTLRGLQSYAFGAEAPPEATRLRLEQISNCCYAPQYMAEHATDFRVRNELKKG